MHVTKNSSWLEHVWTSCRPDDGLNEGAETCCRTNNSIKKNVGQFGYNTAVFCVCPILSMYCQNLKLALWPACSADLCMWPVCAWKYERQDMAIPSSQHTEDGLEDTIQPAVLAVSEQELQFWEFFLAGVNRGCKLEVISIACFNM